MNCLACGAKIYEDDLDFVYPNNTDGTMWTVACPYCSLFMTGNTEEEAIAAWKSLSKKEAVALEAILARISKNEY